MSNSSPQFQNLISNILLKVNNLASLTYEMIACMCGKDHITRANLWGGNFKKARVKVLGPVHM